MKRYLFTVRLIGCGSNVENAWQDAIESTDLYEDATPDKDDIEELEEEEDD